MTYVIPQPSPCAGFHAHACAPSLVTPSLALIAAASELQYICDAIAGTAFQTTHAGAGDD